jgi:hypothetical protein
MNQPTSAPAAASMLPPGFPYPGSPPYSTGQYGEWTLWEKPEETYELGYFTGFGAEPPGHYLVRDGHIWMSDSRLERESHAVHLKHARGTVVVCGVGMGMYLYNIAGMPEVERIIAVDLERPVMDLVQHATGFDDWPGRRKIRFVQKNALHLTPDDVGPHAIDYLYVDIWPELGDPGTISQTRAIQAVVRARKIGWWGQELDFVQWLFENRPAGHAPTLADHVAFEQFVALPMEAATPEYLAACVRAGVNYSNYGTLPFAVANRSAPSGV